MIYSSSFTSPRPHVTEAIFNYRIFMPKPSKSAATSSAGFEDGKLVVTSQQSRFHADAVDAPTSKDIDVKDLTLSIGGRELLDHAHLRITEGVHYVLAGRNGTGKSSLLRALAERRVPGVPSNLRLLLLGQTRVSSDALTDPVQAEDSANTVLEHVTRSDQRRERALKEANRTYHLSYTVEYHVLMLPQA